MITSRAIAEVKFSKPPIGKRGYNEDEVDAFLDMVEVDLQDYEAMAREYDDLKAREDRQMLSPPVDPERTPIQMTPAPPPPPQPEPISAQAARILELAEQTAQALTSEAEAKAAQVTREAEQKAAVLLSEARAEASRTVDAAKFQAAETEGRIATLREFETNYRGRLDAYIASQLDALRADAVVDPAQ